MTERKKLTLLGLCALALGFMCYFDLSDAMAGDPLPGQPNWVVAELAGAPSAVTVDVIDVAASTQVGNNLATTQIQDDAVDSIAFRFNLATVTGYPTDCSPKTYYLVFNPDAADCSEAGTPDLCATTSVQVGGSACNWVTAGVDFGSPSFVHTTTVVSAQGITQAVLDFYNRRGILPLKWRKLPVAADLDFGTPEATYWEVYFYTATNNAPRIRCTVLTTTNPATTLPSSAHCEG